MDKLAISSFLQEISLFSKLPSDLMERVARRATFHKHSKYDYVYSSGEKAKRVFFLKKGCVKIGIHSGDGREVIKSVIYPNAMFGELSLVGEPKRIDFAQCMDHDTQMVSVDVSIIQELMQQQLQMSLKLYEVIGERLIGAERRLASLMLKDARGRIIEFIKENVRQNGKRVGYETLIRHSLTQQDIANITGTSRQTVTSVLNDLKKSNLIYFNRKSILVRDVAKLA